MRLCFHGFLMLSGAQNLLSNVRCLQLMLLKLQDEYDHLQGVLYTDKMDPATLAVGDELWEHSPWMARDIQDDGMTDAH